MLKNITNMFKKTWKYLIVALVAVYFIRMKFGPEYLDIFGLIVFGGLVFLGLWELYQKKPMPDWVAFGLLVIGLGGLIVDGITSFNILKSWILRGLI
jgi:hypothetical protein